MLLFTCLFHSLTVCPCCKRRWEVWIQRRKKEREKISANVHIHFCFPWHRFHCKRISQYNCIAYNVTWYHVPVFKTTICNICYLNGKFTWKMAMQLNGDALLWASEFSINSNLLWLFGQCVCFFFHQRSSSIRTLHTWHLQRRARAYTFTYNFIMKSIDALQLNQKEKWKKKDK